MNVMLVVKHFVARGPKSRLNLVNIKMKLEREREGSVRDTLVETKMRRIRQWFVEVGRNMNGAI
jgi:hypothetical protein